jgi:hypothetical protein
MLPPELAYRYSLHRIKIDALSEIRRKVDLERHEPSELLSSIIEIYDRFIIDTAPPKLDAFGESYFIDVYRFSNKFQRLSNETVLDS